MALKKLHISKAPVGKITKFDEWGESVPESALPLQQIHVDEYVILTRSRWAPSHPTSLPVGRHPVSIVSRSWWNLVIGFRSQSASPAGFSRKLRCQKWHSRQISSRSPGESGQGHGPNLAPISETRHRQTPLASISRWIFLRPTPRGPPTVRWGTRQGSPLRQYRSVIHLGLSSWRGSPRMGFGCK
jgi:hypothetical protein